MGAIKKVLTTEQRIVAGVLACMRWGDIPTRKNVNSYADNMDIAYYSVLTWEFEIEKIMEAEELAKSLYPTLDIS